MMHSSAAVRDPAYESYRVKALQPAKVSSSSVDVINPIYEPGKISEEEGDDYVVMDTKEAKQNNYVSVA